VTERRQFVAARPSVMLENSFIAILGNYFSLLFGRILVSDCVLVSRQKRNAKTLPKG
jgi:hypothetical protein